MRRYEYEVFSAANAEEAIQFCKAYSGSIALVVTDVVMPGLNGRELGKLLAVLRPEARFLYMSGYTDNAIVHYGVLDDGVEFLQKPFGPEALAAKVRQVLDKQNPAT